VKLEVLSSLCLLLHPDNCQNEFNAFKLHECNLVRSLLTVLNEENLQVFNFFFPSVLELSLLGVGGIGVGSVGVLEVFRVLELSLL
jgi:hypothetical protein